MVRPRLCPCGSGRDLARCCGPYLDGEPAPTPEALMRSRYTANALGNRGDPRAEAHLFRTWHPRTRPVGPLLSPGLTWTGLEVLRTCGGGSDGSGVVEFEASFVDEGGHAGRLRETSRFTRRAGRWVYVDGDVS